jgi:hypothetical protein
MMTELQCATGKTIVSSVNHSADCELTISSHISFWRLPNVGDVCSHMSFGFKVETTDNDAVNFLPIILIFRRFVIV